MSPAGNGVLAIGVDLLTFTHTMHFSFLPTSRLGSLSSWCRFSPELVSSRAVGFRFLLRPPSLTAIFYGFIWYCGVRHEDSRKGSREGQNQGEFPHTVLSTSSIISAFLCGSHPFIGFNKERCVKLVTGGRHL
jgi:hypothetical protein